MDWGTLVFDFGRREVRNFLVANATYWLEEFHVDGLRVDAVASMLYLDYSRKEGEWSPNQYGGRENLEAVEFLQEMNAVVYRRVPGVMTIAEESTAWPGVSRPTHLGGLGFGFKWNMGWMHDSLDYVAREPVHRGYHHHQMTFSMVYAYSENYVLPISHDEVVHGKGSLLRKMPGDRWQQLANVRAYLAFMWAHPGKQLLFMGQEFAQESEWSEERSLDWWLLDLPDHRGVALTVKELNEVYKATPGAVDAGPRRRPASPGSTPTTRRATSSRSCASAPTARRSPASRTSPACRTRATGSACPGPAPGARCSTPTPRSTSAAASATSASVEATDDGWHGQPASALLRVPPLGTVWLASDGPALTARVADVLEVEQRPGRGRRRRRAAGPHRHAPRAATSTTAGSPAGRCCVTRRGQTVHSSVGGQRDLEAGLPVEPDTLWRIYSMTKPITAVAAMSLYEQAAFSLNDELSRYLPEFADMRVLVGGNAEQPKTVPATEPIRLWHLLSHTAGLTYAFTRSSVLDTMYALRRRRPAGRPVGRPRDHVRALGVAAAAVRARHRLELLGRHRRARPRARGAHRPDARPGLRRARARPARHERDPLVGRGRGRPPPAGRALRARTPPTAAALSATTRSATPR